MSKRGRFPWCWCTTASSPARWAGLINEFEGDARIRDRFQIWVFVYDSGNSIGYSAGRLRAALTTVTENPGLQILETLRVAPRIPAYSISCAKSQDPQEEGDDGVVAYRSAHIPKAVSEKVVRWDHSCQGQPEVIEEIRRILLEHAAAFEGHRP
jgi:hypothetical protein